MNVGELKALANVLRHPGYPIPDGSVALAMYDDHPEITNPGDLHFGITPDKLTNPHESKPWNPIIAHECLQHRLVRPGHHGHHRTSFNALVFNQG